MSVKFTVHTVVKNEDQWIWFALQSVLPFAQEILIYDDASSDHTLEIIQSIKSPKIILKRNEQKKKLIQLRQEQIDKTNTEWFLILDGDEIWPEKELKKLLLSAENISNKKVALVNKMRNCIGDVLHYLPDSAGRYQLAGQKGNFTIRMIRKTKDLELKGQYPLESFVNHDGPIEKQDNNLQFVDCWYLHTTFLQRSSSDNLKTSGSLGKRKLIEKGIKINQKELPEVFYRQKPEFISNPLTKRSFAFGMLANLTTPIINLKRSLR